MDNLDILTEAELRTKYPKLFAIVPRLQCSIVYDMLVEARFDVEIAYIKLWKLVNADSGSYLVPITASPSTHSHPTTVVDRAVQTTGETETATEAIKLGIAVGLIKDGIATHATKSDMTTTAAEADIQPTIPRSPISPAKQQDSVIGSRTNMPLAATILAAAEDKNMGKGKGIKSSYTACQDALLAAGGKNKKSGPSAAARNPDIDANTDIANDDNRMNISMSATPKKSTEYTVRPQSTPRAQLTPRAQTGPRANNKRPAKAMSMTAESRPRSWRNVPPEPPSDADGNLPPPAKRRARSYASRKSVMGGGEQVGGKVAGAGMIGETAASVGSGVGVDSSVPKRKRRAKGADIEIVELSD